jgi:adenosylcobinamide-phosphate synthase
MQPLAAATSARAIGLGLGVLVDAVVGDPRRGHPVAGFGLAASALERRLYGDDRARGAVFAGVCVGGAVAVGLVGERATRGHAAARALVTAAATWAVLGGASLAREGRTMARLLEADDLSGAGGARDRLSHLCARDAAGMEPPDLARATVESLAENVSDAVVAPLLWGAVAGVPGLLGYRAVNTLDAMVGYRSPRYLRFGWASARMDDAANLVPARVSALLLGVCAPAAGGSPSAALAVLRRDGRRHPSPNAGYPEAATAGGLGIALGGASTYHGRVEHRPVLGAHGRAAEVADIRRAVLLTRSAGLLAAALSVLGLSGWTAVRHRLGRSGNE